MLIDDFNELTELNELIHSLTELMNNTGADEESYTKLVDHLTKLTKIKQIIVETKLKDFAEEEKAHEFRVSQELKEKEAIQKATEHVETHRLKEDELTFRRNEHEDMYALKRREIDLKQADAEKPDRVSKDALVAAGASIAGILLIINYERMNVIASKALSFVLKR